MYILCNTTTAEKMINDKWCVWSTGYNIMVQTIKINFIICLTVSWKRGRDNNFFLKTARERAKEKWKESEQEAREQNPCWLPFRRKISCLFMRPMSYLLHKGQSVHLFKVSVFPLSSPPCNKCRGYVIIGPRRITGLADCDDCIKAYRTFVSVSAHLQMSS